MNDCSISSAVLLAALKAGKVLVHYFHWQLLGIWLSITPFTFISISTFILKHFHYF